VAGVVNALDSAGPPPNLPLNYVADSVASVNSPTLRWIYDSQAAPDVKYLSFDTPVGGAPAPDAGVESGRQYCGKAVFTDLHTGGSLEATVATIRTDAPPRVCRTSRRPSSFSSSTSRHA
jgi:hypothetical protein